MGAMSTSIKAKMLAGQPESQFPSMKTLRNAIPQHCFHPSAARSMVYVIRDLLMIISLGWAAITFVPHIPDFTARTAAWIVYGFLQGLIGTGIWILGHEAGHGALFKHQRLNNIIGFFLHSLLLVPYFSWKFSHHRHHRYTGHLEKDTVFVPQTRASYVGKTIPPKLQFLEDTPVYNLVKLIFHQLFGWFSYLFFNASAGNGSLQRDARFLHQSHFDPTSAVFRPDEAPFIVVSDLGLAMTFYAMYQFSSVVGTQNVLLVYVLPYFWVHHWLARAVAITYLHHTHIEVPHYEPERWSFVKGALTTVDREFGFIGRHLFHGIIEYHVVHHLFPRIPFYHAEEATEAIRPILGNLYRHDDRFFISQLWTTFRKCKYVEPDDSAPGTLKWVARAQ